jgi:hypothetical protein
MTSDQRVGSLCFRRTLVHRSLLPTLCRTSHVASYSYSYSKGAHARAHHYEKSRSAQDISGFYVFLQVLSAWPWPFLTLGLLRSLAGSAVRLLRRSSAAPDTPRPRGGSAAPQRRQRRRYVPVCASASARPHRSRARSLSRRTQPHGTWHMDGIGSMHRPGAAARCVCAARRSGVLPPPPRQLLSS